MKRWRFSLILGVIYLAVFHLWMHVDRRTIFLTGLIATALASGLFLWAEHGKYFLNNWDRLFHAAVIFDILLEGLLIPGHDHYGFYLCAIAFAIVLGGYRAWHLRAQKELAPRGQTPR
ncbi:MAG: hypothetical protein L0Z50_03815 [Verrucomicrobiales bacterium]|nr:hypothetical protein [Verrucomicrobiales bacterium]